MVDLSYRLANDFLRHSEFSPCLFYNPIGRPGVRLRKLKGFSFHMLNSHPQAQRPAVGQEYLAP